MIAHKAKKIKCSLGCNLHVRTGTVSFINMLYSQQVQSLL